MKRVLLLFLCLAATAVQAGLVLLPGSSPQTVKAGEALLPIRVQLTDDRGMPVRGTSVGYSVPPRAVLAPPVPCPGVGAPCGVFTDDSGIALLPPMIALQPGHWLLSITSGAWPAVFADITIVAPEAPASLEIAAGNDQVLPAGASGMPFFVRVVRNAQPVAAESVRFTLTSGGGPILFMGGLMIATATTDANGLATSPGWISTAGIGTGRVQVQTVGDSSGHEASTQFTYHIVNSKGATYYQYKPLWWGGASQSGWGVAIPQHAEHVFPVYFSYDSANRPTWKALQGEWVGGVGESFRGEMYGYAGAPYFDFDTTKVHMVEAMSTLLSFQSKVTAAYFTLNANTGNIDPPPPSTVLSIEPFSFAPAVARPELGVSDIWWGGPSQSGWGIHIAEDQGNLFLTWFTYDADGRATWFAMPEGQWTDDHTWTGPVVKTSGSSRLAGDYSAAAFSATKVGDFSIRFTGTTAATFIYDVEGHKGTLNLQRFDY